MFLSLRMHARHWSNPQGRCFFHCGCMPGTGAIRWGDISFRTRPRRPIEPPILTHRTRDQQTGGTGVMGTEGHGRGRGAGGRRQGQGKQQANAPSNISDLAPLVWRAPRGLQGLAAVPEGGGQALAKQQANAPSNISDLAPLVWRAPEGPEGTAAVPEGGGRARAGLEIDHSEPSGSRVAISRAGRRPPAHTAARPFKAGHTAPGTPVGPQATPEIRRVRKRHRHNGRKETPTAPGTP